MIVEVSPGLNRWTFIARNDVDSAGQKARIQDLITGLFGPFTAVKVLESSLKATRHLTQQLASYEDLTFAPKLRLGGDRAIWVNVIFCTEHPEPVKWPDTEDLLLAGVYGPGKKDYKP